MDRKGEALGSREGSEAGVISGGDRRDSVGSRATVDTLMSGNVTRAMPPNGKHHGMANYIDTGAAVGDYDMKKSPSTAAFMHEIIEDRYLTRTRQRLVPKLEHLNEESRIAGALLGAATEAVIEGMNTIAEDDFWKCFEKRRVIPWNWNIFLLTMWSLGVFFRHAILFPLRLLILALGWIFFGGGMVLVKFVPLLGRSRRSSLERTLISLMSSCFVLTWSGVIRYHGHIPNVHSAKPARGSSSLEGATAPPAGAPKTNYVFVANHTSLIDVIVLQQVKCFSLVGQRHKGLVRFLQDKVLGCLQCIWFDRGEMKDRAIVSRKLSEHVKDPTRNPLLVFPEGTCVNNEHVIQFKKGVFELGVPIAPIAIRYNKLFVDPFWSSREQSFAAHLVELMTSWCMICDVYFMEPTTRKDGESAEEFALRVRNSIADKAGIKPVDWDGYLKHFQPNERLLNQRKQVYADAFKKLLEDVQESRLNQAAAFGNEDLEDDFYIGAPSPTISISSEHNISDGASSTLMMMNTRRGSSSNYPAHTIAPRLGPATLTQRLKDGNKPTF